MCSPRTSCCVYDQQEGEELMINDAWGWGFWEWGREGFGDWDRKWKDVWKLEMWRGMWKQKHYRLYVLDNATGGKILSI